MSVIASFRLFVRLQDRNCRFTLENAEGGCWNAKVIYPGELEQAYNNWKTAYRVQHNRIRAQIEGKGGVSEPEDLRRKVVNLTSQLEYQFRLWLRDGNLYDIREAIAQTAQASQGKVDVLLSCNSSEIEQLPWESWNIGADLGIIDHQRIRIARTPENTPPYPSQVAPPLRRKARLLAILGEAPELDLTPDEIALSQLKSAVDIHVEKWQPKDDLTCWKKRIEQRLAETWDILFFAGHSGSDADMGGLLSLAPNVTLGLTEIESLLRKANGRGLQVAIFNSCDGVGIAKDLIGFGFSQIVVMRELVYDRAAHVFLRELVKHLAEYKDIHEALLETCQFLEAQIDYPSTHLIPSIYRHPKAALFQIEPFGWGARLNRRLPTSREAIAFGIILFASLLPPIQDLLLDARLGTQAVYRQVTNQIPAKVESPVVLVQIDPDSLKAAQISKPYPIPYDYLAQIIKQVDQLGAQTIGIDYVLDRANEQPQQSRELKQALEQARSQGAEVVFAYNKTNDYSQDGEVSFAIADPNQSLHGNILFHPQYLELLSSGTECDRICPFSYQLSRSYAKSHTNSSLQETLETLRLPGITGASQNGLQAWLHPIVDYSIPPDRAYTRLSSCVLLSECKTVRTTPESLKGEIVVIAAGGYDEAGSDEVAQKWSDSFDIPLALYVWRDSPPRENLMGGEIHAYMLHHLLTQRLVYPIPDSWMILLAALVGKELRLLFPAQRKAQNRWLGIGIGITAIAWFISLQVYVSAGLLVPLVLPSALIWNYIRLARRFGPVN